MQCTLRDVFREHGASYAASHRLHPREARAAWCIANCYSPAAGRHTLRCPQGHVEIEQFHACRHRCCPRCADGPRRAWVDAQLARLLPCPHFHCVFTLPHELLPLWEFNRKAMAALLFDCARECLLQMLADPRHLGATPGLLLSLHTWGRTLSRHPHVHALVTAGGLCPDGRWLATRTGYLLPLKPLQRLFAGKLLARLRVQLERGELRLPSRLPAAHWPSLITALYRAHWNIQINPPYSSGRSVTLYLARYAKGGPLPKDRALSMHAGNVGFTYTDHRDAKVKNICLQAHEFIARLLWHAPPKGLHTIRHAGLYSTQRRHDHLRAGIILGLPVELPHPPASVTATSLVAAPAPQLPLRSLCPTCGRPLQLASTSRVALGAFYPLQSARPRSTHHPPAFARPGPTQRSNGHPTASAGRATPPQYSRLRAAGAGRRAPIN